MIIYCFISHNSVVQKDYDRIKKMMEELNHMQYCVIYGGKRNIENDHVVHIDCDDTYAGLPDKINKTMKYFSSDKKIDYVFKTDRTCIVKKIFDNESIQNIDYAGRILQFRSSTYHYWKCEKTSNWYNKPFNGKNIKYCSGVGYLLSKKSIGIISNDNLEYKNHIYEDYYVGQLLGKKNILPKHINCKQYFFDPEHADCF